jgi:ankyrin repeat protein
MRRILFSGLVLILLGCRLSLKEEAWHTPASSGDTLKLTQLLDSGLDVNATDENGDTPLFFALSNGHISTADYLVSRGALITHVNRTGQMISEKAIKVNTSKEVVDWVARQSKK